MPFFEISTTKYNEDIKLIQVVMTKMVSSCNITAGFKFGEPTSRFGWTFFQMLIDQELYIGINDEFSHHVGGAEFQRKKLNILQKPDNTWFLK